MRLSVKAFFMFALLWAHSSYAVDYFVASSSQSGQPNSTCTAFGTPYAQNATPMIGVNCIASVLETTTGNDYAPANCITLDLDGNLTCQYVVTPPGGPAYPGYSAHVATTYSYPPPATCTWPEVEISPGVCEVYQDCPYGQEPDPATPYACMNSQCVAGTVATANYGPYYATSQTQLNMNISDPACFNTCEVNLSKIDPYVYQHGSNCTEINGSTICEVPTAYNIRVIGTKTGNACAVETPTPECETCLSLEGNPEAEPIGDLQQQPGTNTEITNNPDGTKTETTTETFIDGSTQITVKEYDASGNLTSITGSASEGLAQGDLSGEVRIDESGIGDTPDLSEADQSGLDDFISSITGDTPVTHTGDNLTSDILGALPTYNSCQTLSFNFFGNQTTFPSSSGCVKVEKFKDLIGYVFYILLLFALFDLMFRRVPQ